MEEFELSFVLPGGEPAATLLCRASDTVLCLRKRLSVETETPIALLSLLWRHGERLEDNTRVSDCDLSADVPIILVREPAARLSLVPHFDGIYRGEENEGGGAHVFEIVIDSSEFDEQENREQPVKGIFHWRYLSGALRQNIGRRGRELVHGTVQEDGRLKVEGYEVEPRMGLLCKARYELCLADGGDELKGNFLTQAGLSSDDEFVLTRMGTAEVASGQRR